MIFKNVSQKLNTSVTHPEKRETHVTLIIAVKLLWFVLLG